MKRHRFLNPKASRMERSLNKLVAKIEREEREGVTPALVIAAQKASVRAVRFNLFNHKES